MVNKGKLMLLQLSHQVLHMTQSLKRLRKKESNKEIKRKLLWSLLLDDKDQSKKLYLSQNFTYDGDINC